ncbi:MAG TPA: hypothetical protein VJB36_09975, partial [Methylomirabilota bacterium]|nr:hypothetical protein [Methylomirabilota bacterium]
MRKTPLLAATLALAAGFAARADTVEVTSTTFVTAGEQTRYRSGSEPDLVTVVPAYSILSITAREVTNPIADDLRLVVSTWGAYDFADPRWDNGTTSELTGDVTTGYVQAGFAGRRLTLRLGRTHVMTGVARMLNVDGGEAIVLLPGGVRISGYAGLPVSQRFASRSGIRSWNPAAGDLAFGGRLGWTLATPGLAGRGLDLGASANVVQDGDDPVRQEVGVDLRLQPFARTNLTLAGMGAFSLYDERFSEANVSLTWSARRRLHLTADWRFTAPDLLLARNSILSVFSSSEWNELGGGVRYELGRGLSTGADYHVRLEPGEEGEDAGNIGHDAAARLDWERSGTSAGLEASYLEALDNGYIGTRGYGRRDFGRLSPSLGNVFVSADVLAHFFREAVNGEDFALTGTLS